MSDQLHILFVVPSLARAGAETQVIDLVNGLDDERFEKHVFCFEKQLDQLPRLDTARIRFYHQPRQSKFDLSVPQRLARLIDEHRIDIVHCTLQFALLVGWIGTRLAARKPRLVVTVHTTINRDRKSELLDRLLYRWIMNDCHRIVFVCQSQRSHWNAKFASQASRSEVIYNGIDPDYFDPGRALADRIGHRAALDIPEHAPVVCAIAAFRPEKGHLILVEAFSRVAAELDAYLILAGDGQRRPQIEERVRTLGIGARVRFLGPVADVRPTLAASDIMVMASTAVETFSLAILESLSMRVPVIATDIGGARESVPHGQCGLIVPPGSIDSLVSALRELLIDKHRRETLGRAGQTRVREQFHRQSMIRRYATMFEQVGFADINE